MPNLIRNMLYHFVCKMRRHASSECMWTFWDNIKASADIGKW